MKDEAIKSFVAGKYDVLIATNLTGRALNFPDVGVVLQAEFPADVEVYTQRVGCAGRSGAAGRSLAYLALKDAPLAPALLQLLQRDSQEVPSWLPDLVSGSADVGM